MHYCQFVHEMTHTQCIKYPLFQLKGHSSIVGHLDNLARLTCFLFILKYIEKVNLQLASVCGTLIGPHCSMCYTCGKYSHRICILRCTEQIRSFTIFQSFFFFLQLNNELLHFRQSTSKLNFKQFF